MNTLYTRLDNTLETVNIASPAIAPRILYGIAYPADIIKTSALSPRPDISHPHPYLRLTPSSKWAVRLIPIDDDISTRAAQIAYLSQRDGWNCFYCDQPMTATTATIEHIVPVAHGGPTNAHNLCLAHESCNAAAGSLPVFQKVQLAIGVRVGAIAAGVFKEQLQRRRRTAKGGTK